MSRSLASALLPLALLFGCGEVKTNHLADGPAGGSDGAVGSDASAAGRISVKLLDSFNGSGAPVVGAIVVFTDAHGSQRAATDATGTASAVVDTTATVTAIDGNGLGAGTLVQTIFGAKTGDVITLGEARSSTPLGNFTVNFTPIAGIAANYQIFGPCGSTSTSSGTGTLNFSSDCQQDPMELLVRATNATNGTSLGYLDKAGVTFVAGGSTTIPGNFRAEQTFTASYTNAAQVASIDLSRMTPDNFGFVSGNSATVANGVASISTTGPATSTAIASTQLTRTGFGAQQILQRLAGNATTYGLDVGASALAWLGPPTYDVPTRTLHVPVATDDASSDAPDLFFAELSYNRPVGDAGVNDSIVWLMFDGAPGDHTFPTLPGDLAAFTPAATDQIGSISLGSIETDDVPGYDGGRLDAYHLADVLTQPRNVTGRARFARTSTATVR